MSTFSSLDEDPLIKSARTYVEEYMSHYDASHDFNHIRRVLRMAQHIYQNSPRDPNLDLRAITLAALLHDVGDRKYLKPGEDPETMVYRVLVDNGAEAELAQKVQTICLGVSYSSEVKDPGKVRELIARYPELAVVQDADRLDAIGAIGIGRCFTFGGAKTARSMDLSIEHFDEKLVKIESMMKTDAGRELAKERTQRLRAFQSWWSEEQSFAADGDR